MSQTNAVADPTANALIEKLVEELRARDQMEQAVQNRLKNNVVSEVVYSKETQEIVIPFGMTEEQAADQLILIHQSNEKIVTPKRTFKGWHWHDALHAVKVVTERTFGFINGKTVRTMFGDYHPEFINITTDIIKGVEVTEECFFGRIEVGLWDNAQMDISVKGGQVTIEVNCKKRFKDQVSDYFNSITHYLKHSSIFRGKAIVVNDNMSFKIIELEPNEHIMLNPETETMVENLIKVDMLETGKRIYLFTGPYGNGKTETSLSLGVYAKEIGQSFFYVKNPDEIVSLLEVIDNYCPCVIFVEDIDEITSGSDRNSDINQILNTLDGVETKGRNITIVFTTNHETRINPALRRPGRIDAFVKFEDPEKDTRTRIITSMIPKFVKGFTAKQASEIFSKDYSGAIVSEICKRAIKQSRGKAVDKKDFEVAYVSMKYQIEMMEQKVEEIGTPATKLYDAIGTLIQKRLDGFAEEHF